MTDERKGEERRTRDEAVSDLKRRRIRRKGSRGPDSESTGERLPHSAVIGILAQVKAGTLGILSAEDELHDLRARLTESERFTLEEIHDALGEAERKWRPDHPKSLYGFLGDALRSTRREAE